MQGSDSLGGHLRILTATNEKKEEKNKLFVNKFGIAWEILSKGKWCKVKRSTFNRKLSLYAMYLNSFKKIQMHMCKWLESINIHEFGCKINKIIKSNV